MARNIVTLVKESENYLSKMYPIDHQSKDNSGLIYGYMTGFEVGEGKVTLIANHTEQDKRNRLYVMVYDNQSTLLYSYAGTFDYHVAETVLEIVKQVLTDCVYVGSDIHLVAHTLIKGLADYE